MREHFSHVDAWVFDLDNTLYDPSVRLFDQIEEKMRHYICRLLGVDLAEADVLRALYWREHGTTLAGLMAHHEIDPMDFLYDVHALDFSGLSEDPALAAQISALPGRKLVFTNGDAAYARNVLNARGLGDVFEAIYGIEHVDFTPKPQRAAYGRVFEQASVDPAVGAMFEDDVRNLEVPAALGMKTILVHTEAPAHDHIDFRTSNLTHFLSQIVR
ncbi:MAG: pyrimidine 5'-nucleotidase [Rhodobacteraceae bacterium]|nr:pyrimidine 5'-nucleotidase [Paracoccaceae bacterium]